MNFEELYNKALEKAKEFLKNPSVKPYLEQIFPQLRESEDERIRKEIINYLKTVNEVEPDCDHSVIDGWLAYLEKQKEQKPLSPEDKVKHPLYVEGFEAGKEVGRQCEKVFGEQKSAEWNEKDHCKLDTIEKIVRLAMEEELGGYTKEQYKDIAFFLHTKVRPQKWQTWNEEDENRLNYLEHVVENSKENPATKSGLKSFLNRLKSLNLQLQWKPSEEQMEALKVAAFDAKKFPGWLTKLIELYNDLFELK